MTQPQVGSYDDAPESEVSTVLEVPLLWRSSRVSASPATSAEEPRTSADPRARGAHRRPRRVTHASVVAPSAKRKSTGRHRAEAAAPNPAPLTIQAEPEAPALAAPTTRAAATTRASASSTPREELVHTLRVGAVSATIVLVLFVAALLGLATWLP